jgi:hypothetical protein
MVDDTLAVTECGNASVKKNAVVNSFVETQRLTLSTTKSVVVHIGNVKKCEQSCPELKVNKEHMKKVESTKYLGNMISSKGGIQETIEDRRNRGWGKIATIMGILSEITVGSHKMEVGLMLRKTIMINSLLFSAEAWSGVTEKQLARLEVVDTALLRKLAGGHSKCGTEFHHLETGTLKLRHILTYLRLMYHHHILTRDQNETIHKIYQKQKVEKLKGDWFQLLQNDFQFIEMEMNEEDIRSMSKYQYKTKIKALVRKAAFKYFLKLKEKHTKLKNVQYSELKIQPYLQSKSMSNSEAELLYNLRSNCYEAKSNFKKMHKYDLECRFGCKTNEDQIHIFTKCQQIKSQLNYQGILNYDHIYSDIEDQQDIIKVFIKIDKIRCKMKDKLLPVGNIVSQDPCTRDMFTVVQQISSL